MSETLSNMPQHDPIIDSMGRLVKFIFGPDRATRARTGVILLCALMYAICCSAAFYSAEVGMMRDFAPKLLLATTRKYGRWSCNCSTRK